MFQEHMQSLTTRELLNQAIFWKPTVRASHGETGSAARVAWPVTQTILRIESGEGETTGVPLPF